MRRLALLSRNLCASRLLHLSPPCLGKIVPYLLADIGEGIREVEVITLCVAPGDRIEEFEKLCEVQSDKATVDITSRYTGVISAVHITAGGMAIVGEPLVDVELDDPEVDRVDQTQAKIKDGHKEVIGTVEKGQVKVTEEKETTKNVQMNESSSGLLNSATAAPEAAATAAGRKVLATPATRGFARECGVDLTQITGTGVDGRILKEDIDTFNNSKCGVDQDVVVPLTGIRRVMVATMTEARSIPSYTACDEMELTALLSVREMLKDAFALRRTKSDKKGGDAVANTTVSGGSVSGGNNNAAGEGDKTNMRLSLMPFFLKAASMALLQYPELNAHINTNCTNLIVKKSHNVSFAMDTPKGLIVPVVRDVQRKGLFELAVELDELIKLGRRGAIPPECMRGGTFTLSNIGSIGATYATPVLLPPQVVIGAIGRLQALPRFDAKGDIIKANIAYTSWTADHRVIDGATLVRFSNLFRQLLESPGLILSESVN